MARVGLAAQLAWSSYLAYANPFANSSDVLRVRLRPNPLSEQQTPVRPLCSNHRSVGRLYRRIVPTFGLLFVALDPNPYYGLDHKGLALGPEVWSFRKGLTKDGLTG
jgi:hypothetical protein